ncbi:MAG: hypothetical protein PHR70_03405 [Tissierellia bacterium]|nr:hypothetical protein [Tissierellia bacterium]
MQKIDYELINKLNLDTTNKVYNFINDKFEIDDILDKIKFDFPFFMDNGNKLRLVTWLSIDYINEDGKTFIEKFLESNPKNLTNLEGEFLLSKNSSFISLFEILNINEEHIIVHDLLKNKEFYIYEKLMKEYFNEGDLLFARIGKFFSKYSFIGDISLLPQSAKDTFIEQYLIDFNYKRKEETSLVIEDYIKKHSLEIIKIYNNCILSILELDDNLNLYLYDELDEFESYLSNKYEFDEIKEYVANLIEFFDYYLSEDVLTLYDLKDLDLRLFFELAINEGFIYSQECLNSYISTFKNYLYFLSKKNKEFEKKYRDIIDISKNRFSLMENLNNINAPFSINRNLVNEIEDFLNDTSISLLLNLDKFLLYFTDNEIEVTRKKKMIKKSFLPELCFLLNDNEIIDLKPSQRELFLVDLFYRLSLSEKLILIKEDMITLSKNGISFLNLKDENKFSVIVNYIWNYIESINAKDKILSLIKDLKSSEAYDVKDLISKYEGTSKEISQIHEYFKTLGLTKSNYYPTYTWEISELGKAVFIYYYNIEFKEGNNSIINLNNYKQNSRRGEEFGKSKNR